MKDEQLKWIYGSGSCFIGVGTLSKNYHFHARDKKGTKTITLHNFNIIYYT